MGSFNSVYAFAISLVTANSSNLSVRPGIDLKPNRITRYNRDEGPRRLWPTYAILREGSWSADALWGTWARWICSPGTRRPICREAEQLCEVEDTPRFSLHKVCRTLGGLLKHSMSLPSQRHYALSVHIWSCSCEMVYDEYSFQTRASSWSTSERKLGKRWTDIYEVDLDVTEWYNDMMI